MKWRAYIVCVIEMYLFNKIVMIIYEMFCIYSILYTCAGFASDLNFIARTYYMIVIETCCCRNRNLYERCKFYLWTTIWCELLLTWTLYIFFDRVLYEWQVLRGKWYAYGSMGHVTLAVVTGTTISVPYLEVKSPQVICSSDGHKCHLSRLWMTSRDLTIYIYIYIYTVKPVCNVHLYNKIHYLLFIQ